jgi:hypothetical protein
LRLNDPDPSLKLKINRLLRWHAGYILVVAIFFAIIYITGLFRSNFFLKERFIYLGLAPICTFFFVLISPWRSDWYKAIKDMYFRLDGQEVLCVLAAFVFLFGFFLYGVFIWGLGALGPSLAYM